MTGALYEPGEDMHFKSRVSIRFFL